MHTPSGSFVRLGGRGMPHRAIGVVVACLAFVAGGLGTAGAEPPPVRPRGDSAVISRVPERGFPEGLAISGNRMYVSSPAQNAQTGPAQIFVFDTATGAYVMKYDIPATDPITDHGLVGIALDGSGHLYVADIPRGIVQLKRSSGASNTYATVPDIPPCLPLPLLPGPCSPTVGDRAPFPNDIVFDAAGNAYVSDSAQATIWKLAPPPAVPPGQKATAQVWYQDAVLDGALGANGVRLSPDGKELCVAVFGPPGSVHCIAVVNGKAGARRQLPATTEGPDNLTFGESGKMYVALALSNQVVVLDYPSGTELERFSGPAKSPSGDVPWDAPASVAFDNTTKSLRVTNHALVTGLVDKSRFVVFDVYVDDTAFPLHRPALPWTG